MPQTFIRSFQMVNLHTDFQASCILQWSFSPDSSFKETATRSLQQGNFILLIFEGALCSAHTPYLSKKISVHDKTPLIVIWFVMCWIKIIFFNNAQFFRIFPLIWQMQGIVLCASCEFLDGSKFQVLNLLSKIKSWLSVDNKILTWNSLIKPTRWTHLRHAFIYVSCTIFILIV